MIKLRPWQEKALAKAIDWLTEKRTDRHFLINAAPGAGKTLAACAIADRLFASGEIDRVIVIAPRSEVVNQWAKDFLQVTKRYMGKVTSGDGDIAKLGHDVCATWAAIQGLSDAFQAVCSASKVLLICDEHHHAAVKASWGSSADSAFASARYVLVLTGTPIRSDGEQSVWMAYDNQGVIDHPEEGTFTLSYGDAVDLEYCRPVTFHRHEGHFTIDLEDGEPLQISSKRPAELRGDLKRIPGLQRALNFYRLACTPQYEEGSKKPLLTGYQATMIEYGGQKLTDLRNRMPNAGGLVIAPTIEVAEYMVELIEALEGETPILVHSQLRNADSKIDAFRKMDKRWLVSVAMVSEGVDIPRLRVLVHLPSALTELSFRQAIGRIVRTAGPDDDTRGYVVMPSFDILETYARRVEDEMSAAAKVDSGPAKRKKCPSCNHECELSAESCPSCGHKFPAKKTNFKPCPKCDALNPIGAKECQACGASFAAQFSITLEEALRTGAIVRGMDIDEDEVKDGEAMAEDVREKILKSGDDKLVRLVKVLPEESWARLRNILE